MTRTYFTLCTRILTTVAALTLPLTGTLPAANAEPLPRNTAHQVEHPLHATMGQHARIADDTGNTVLLRGVNVNGLGQYYREWPDLPATTTLTEDDFERIAALGSNVVRLIISWSALEPVRGVVDHGYLDRIAQAVEWARANDIYVQLDMHQDAWGTAVNTRDGVYCPPLTEPDVGWDGAPAWATALVGTPATCRISKRELSVAVQSSFQNFYLDVNGVQSELVNTWAAVAARFAHDPVVVGYDLLNEPNPGLLVGVDDYVLLGNYYRRAMAAIRAAEQAAGGFRHIMFFEPSVITGGLAFPGPLPLFTSASGSASGSGTGSGLGSATGSAAGSASGSAGDENLVYAPHQYNESISPLPGSLASGFADTATAAAGYGTTFFNGEWGFWDSDPAVIADKTRRYAALEDKYLIGGTYWQWRQACGDPHNIQTRGTRPTCTAPDTGLDHDPATASVIARPYPRSAPGLPTGLTSDIGSGAMTLTGTAETGGGRADLWVPQRCANPALSGSNITQTGRAQVPGGWRITAATNTSGDYRAVITCG
ncbi:glycoside hydrolase family 5 protein [Nocardia acidivorans]|uniref:glycoside hydrolase family 5 protein n=1 Tax=Nocardia acidivorans TaxID=404580 RepID=UPI00082EB659|nr:cellulase family glycosylhydrolase [Nocardia acidivorans]